MRRLIIVLFTGFILLGSRAQIPNVFISALNFPNEPSICISPKSPNIMVAGANINALYYSSDYGLTWTVAEMTSSHGVYGDPCIIADSAGNFYYFHLSGPPSASLLDRIVCQKSTDNGHSWSDGSYTGLNGTRHQDKSWAVADPKSNNVYTCWTQFDKYGSAKPADSSNILFSGSADGGLTWSEPLRINKVAGDCLDSSNTVEGAYPAIGPNGEIYVSWSGPAGLVFAKSTDRGLTWPSGNILVSTLKQGWSFDVPGLYSCNGMPVTCCDYSAGPYHGNIYINWSDQKNGVNNTDIFLSKSTDGGQNWSSPKIVNNDSSNRHQFMSSMTVDQSTGILYFVFYDRRNYSDLNTDVYLAISRDGGESFQNFKISEKSFIPNPSIFFGDYTAISALNNKVRPVWTNLNEGILSMMVAIVDSASYLYAPELQPAIPACLEQNYPNPASSFTYMSFKLIHPSEVTLTLLDCSGKTVAELLHRKNLPAGKYAEGIDLLLMGLEPGIYFYRLQTADFITTKKMVMCIQ